MLTALEDNVRMGGSSSFKFEFKSGILTNH